MISKSDRQRMKSDIECYFRNNELYAPYVMLELEEAIEYKGKMCPVAKIDMNADEMDKLRNKTNISLIESQNGKKYLLVSKMQHPTLNGGKQLKYIDITQYYNNLSNESKNYVIELSKFFTDLIDYKLRDFYIEYDGVNILLWVQGKLYYDALDDFSEACFKNAKGVDFKFIKETSARDYNYPSGTIYKLLTCCD